MITTGNVLYEISRERSAQDLRWGEQNHPDVVPGDVAQRVYASQANGWKAINAARVEQQNAAGLPSDRNAFWDGILLEEVYEALAESDPAKLRAELIQVAAVAVAWVECIDRRTS